MRWQNIYSFYQAIDQLIDINIKKKYSLVLYSTLWYYEPKSKFSAVLS